jgi:hypothetical protein
MQPKQQQECSLLKYLQELEANDEGTLSAVAHGASNIIADMVEYHPTSTNYLYLGMLLSELATERPEVKQIIVKGSTCCDICNNLMADILAQ